MTDNGTLSAAEIVRLADERSLVGLVMTLTGGSANPDVVRHHLARLRGGETQPSQFSLQLLHDLEIAGSITWLFDGDWHVDIGSPVQAEANVSSEREALDWLKAKAREIYRAGV